MTRIHRLLTISLLLACGGEKAPSAADTQPAAGAPAAARDAEDAEDAPSPTDGSGADQAASAVPAPSAEIPRAEQAMAGKAKALKSLFFETRGLEDLYAVEATAQVPAWSAPADGDPAQLRDDDANTTVTCTPAADKACAIALHFAEPVDLELVRMFAAAGPHWRTFSGHPRPRQVRVHTDAGYTEVELPDGEAHRYVRLPARVRTQFVAVEVLDTHAGTREQALHFGELEAYAGAGPRRPALDLDPALATFAFETERWKAKGSEFVPRPSYLDFLDSSGSARRFGRADALYGKRGDRFLLYRKTSGTDCTKTTGAYVLIDQHTRMQIDLGELGGVTAPVYRHGQGLGFVVGDIDADGFPLKGARLEDDELQRIRPPKNGPKGSPKEQLAAWGFELEPSPPDGAASLGAPTGACGPASAEDLAKIQSELEGHDGAGDLSSPDRWLRCDAGASRQVLLAGGSACGAAHVAIALDATGTITDRRWSETPDARGPRAAHLADGTLAIELDRKHGNESALWTLDPAGKLTKLASGTGFSLREPGACACESGDGADVDPGAGE